MRTIGWIARRVTRLLVVLVAAYAVIVMGGCSLQRQLLYHPSQIRPTPASVGLPSLRPVTLTTADGLSLLAWWKAPARPDAPVIVFYHGNAGHLGNHSGKLPPYLARGWGVLLPAWRGYSGNPGSPTEKGLYQDGRAALAFLAARGIPAARTVLYGSSLGSGVAVQIASETRVGAVVLEAPYTSMVDVGRAHFPWLPVRLLVRDRFESAAKIARIGAPLLIIHGTRDDVVPVELGQHLFETARAPKTLELIDGAGHNELYAFGAEKIVAQFIEKYLIF